MSGYAFPAPYGASINDEAGLTKRELACIELRIPKTGDAELDALIAEAQRRDAAVGLMATIVASGENSLLSDDASVTLVAADALLAELAKGGDA